MGETVKTENAPKKSWSKGLKSEFNKITWPDRKSLIKRTTAVAAASVFLGVIITILDAIIKYGVDFLIK